MAQVNGVVQKPGTIHGRLIAVSDDGRRARVYDFFHVRELRIGDRLAENALAAKGHYVTLHGAWDDDVFCVGEISEVSADASSGEDLEFKLLPDGRIDWSETWPADEDPQEFDEALRSWRRA